MNSTNKTKTSLAKFEEFFSTIYKDDVFEILEKYPDERSLTVNYEDLEMFDPDLADLLIEKPDEVILASQKAIKNIDPLMKDAELKNNYSNLEVQYNETGNKIYMMDNITLEREFVNAQVELVRVKNDISDVESALSMGKQASEVDKRLQLAKDDLKIAQEAYNSLSVK